MKINLEILASVTVHRKKPWSKLAWVGKEKEKVLLLHKRKCSLFHFSSGKTKNNNKLNALMKNALCYNITNDGNYVIGLLQSANLFVWEKDSDCIWTVEGLGASFPHEIAQHDAYIFANDNIENILLVIKFKQIFLWERSDLDNCLNSKHSFLTGSWMTVNLDMNILLPIPDAKDAIICSTFINNMIIGKQCICSFIFTYNNNICISTVHLKKQYQIHTTNLVSSYSIIWHSRNLSCTKLGTMCRPMNCHGAYVALYSNQGDILTIAVNQRNAFNSRILFMSSLSSAFLVNDLKGCGAKSDSAANQRRHFVADMKWALDDSFLVCVTHQGNFFLTTRLGDILTISAQGCDIDISSSHFLYFHTYMPARPISHTSDAPDNEEVHTISSISIQNRTQRFSVTSHPHLPLLLCSDGFTVTCLMLPSALVIPTNIVEFLILESSITLVKLRKKFNIKNVSFRISHSPSKMNRHSVPVKASKDIQSANDENCSEENSITYSHVTPSESVENADVMTIQNTVDDRNTTAGMDHLLDFASESLRVPEINSAIKTLLDALSFCASNKTGWNEKWEILSTNIIQQLLKAFETIFLISLGTNEDGHWKNSLQSIQLILLKCINLLNFDIEQQNLLAFGLKLVTESGKKLISIALKRLKKLALFWQEVFFIISSLECELASVYHWTQSFEAIIPVYSHGETSTSHDVYEYSRFSEHFENEADCTRHAFTNHCLMQKLSGMWKFFYKIIVNYFSSINATATDNEIENYFKVLCLIQKKLLILKVPLNTKKYFKCKKGEKITTTEDDLKLITKRMKSFKNTKVNRKSAKKMKKQFLSVLYTLLRNYSLSSAMEFAFKLIANESQNSKHSMDETMDKEMLIVSTNPVIKSVILSFARFMSYYFTNQELSILPPHKPHLLPSFAEKISATESLNLSREKIQSLIKTDPMPLLWTPETAIGLFIKCGALAEATSFAQQIGDWKSSLILSSACEEANNLYLHLAHKERTKSSLSLSEELKPSMVLFDKIKCLLGIDDNQIFSLNNVSTMDTNKKLDDFSGAKKISEFLKEINRSSKKIVTMLTEYITACVMCGFDVVPVLVEQLLKQLLSLIKGLPLDIHQDFPLPVPPVFCPQDNSEGVSTCEDESVRRNAISFVIQLILIILKSSNVLIPLAYSYASNITNLKNGEDLASLYDTILQPFLGYKENNIVADLFLEGEDHPTVLKLKQSFADLCLLTWILQIRDTLQTEYRKMWNIIEKLPAFTNSEKYSKQCLTVLKWCKQLQPFAEFMEWKLKLCEIALTVVLESPPSVQVAKMFASCYPDSKEIPSECDFRMNLLLKKWKKIGFHLKSHEKSKLNGRPSQRMLLSDYFMEHCHNELLAKSRQSGVDKDEMYPGIKFLVQDFDPNIFFFEFLIIFLDVTVHKDIDEFYSISVSFPLLTINSELLKKKEFGFLPEDSDMCDGNKKGFENSIDLLENQMNFMSSVKKQNHLKSSEQHPSHQLTRSISDSELSRSSTLSKSPQREVKKKIASFENLKKFDSKQENIENKKLMKKDSLCNLNQLNASQSFRFETQSDQDLILSKIHQLSTRTKYNLSLKIKLILWMGHWTKRIHALNSPLSLNNHYSRPQIRLQITLLQILNALLAVSTNISNKYLHHRDTTNSDTNECLISPKEQTNLNDITENHDVNNTSNHSLNTSNAVGFDKHEIVLDSNPKSTCNDSNNEFKSTSLSKLRVLHNPEKEIHLTIYRSDKKNSVAFKTPQRESLSYSEDKKKQTLSPDIVSDYKDLKCEVSCSVSNLFKKPLNLQEPILSSKIDIIKKNPDDTVLDMPAVITKETRPDECLVQEIKQMLEIRDFSSVMEKLHNIEQKIKKLDKIPQSLSREVNTKQQENILCDDSKQINSVSPMHMINGKSLSENSKTNKKSKNDKSNILDTKPNMNCISHDKSKCNNVKYSSKSVLSNNSKADLSNKHKNKMNSINDTSNCLCISLLEDTLNDVSSPSSMQVSPTEFSEPVNNLSLSEQRNFDQSYQIANLEELKVNRPNLDVSKNQELNLHSLYPVTKKDEKFCKSNAPNHIPHFLRLPAERENSMPANKIPVKVKFHNNLMQNLSEEDRLRGGGSRTTAPFPLLQLPPSQNMNTRSPQTYSTNLIHVQPSSLMRGLPLLTLPQKYKTAEPLNKPRVNFSEDTSLCSHNMYIQDILHNYWQGIQNSALQPKSFANIPIYNECQKYSSSFVPSFVEENNIVNRPLFSSEILNNPPSHISAPSTAGSSFINSIHPSQYSAKPSSFNTVPSNIIQSHQKMSMNNDIASNSIQTSFANDIPVSKPCLVSDEVIPTPAYYSDISVKESMLNNNSYVYPKKDSITSSQRISQELPLCHFHCLHQDCPATQESMAIPSSYLKPCSLAETNVVMSHPGPCLRRAHTANVPVCESVEEIAQIVPSCSTSTTSVHPCSTVSLDKSENKTKICKSYLNDQLQEIVHTCDSMQNVIPAVSTVPICKSVRTMTSYVPPCKSVRIITPAEDTVPVCESVRNVKPCENISHVCKSMRATLPVPSCEPFRNVSTSVHTPVLPCQPVWRNEDGEVPPCMSIRNDNLIVSPGSATVLVPACKSSEQTVPICKSQFFQPDYYVKTCPEDTVPVCKSLQDVPICKSELFNTKESISIPLSVPSCHSLVTTCQEDIPLPLPIVLPCHKDETLNYSKGMSGVKECSEIMHPNEKRSISVETSPRWFDSHKHVCDKTSNQVMKVSTVDEGTQVSNSEIGIDKKVSCSGIIDIHAKVIRELEEQKRLVEELQCSSKPTETKGIQTASPDDSNDKVRQTSGQDIPVVPAAHNDANTISSENERNGERIEQMEILDSENELKQGYLIENTTTGTNSNKIYKLSRPLHHSLLAARTEHLPKIVALNNVQKQLQSIQENCEFIENLSQSLQSSFQNNEQILSVISNEQYYSLEHYENAIDDGNKKIEDFKFLKDFENIVIDPNKLDTFSPQNSNRNSHSVPEKNYRKFPEVNKEKILPNRVNLLNPKKLQAFSTQSPDVPSSAHKKSNQVTFDKNEELKINLVPSSTNEISRPSDQESMITNRKWESLKQTINESKNSIMQELNVEAPQLSPKSRLHARQIQKSHHFKLRLQEACHLMDDLMSIQPDFLTSAPTVSATSSPSPLQPEKRQHKLNDATKTLSKPNLQQSNKGHVQTVKKQIDRGVEKVKGIPQSKSISHLDNIHDKTKQKPPRRKLALKSNLTIKKRRLGIKSNNSVNEYEKPSRTLSMGRDIHVASTIAEISEETYSTSKPNATLPIYKKASKPLIVRMTRAAALRKKLSHAKMGTISKKPTKSVKKAVNKENVVSPQLVQTPRVYDDNFLLRRVVNITSYTDRLKDLQNKTELDVEKIGSPYDSYISEISNPSTWEIGDDIKAILYGNESLTGLTDDEFNESDGIEPE